MGIERFFGKKYRLETSENFDEYMKEMGVGPIGRKMGTSQSPVINLDKEGDRFVISSSSPIKNVSWKFKPGVEEEQQTPDGRTVKSLFTIDGNVITEVQKEANGRTSTIIRSFSDKELKIVLKVDGTVSYRVFKAE